MNQSGCLLAWFIQWLQLSPIRTPQASWIGIREITANIQYQLSGQLSQPCCQYIGTCPFNHLSFILAYCALHTYGLSSQSLCSCSTPGSVCLWWIFLTICYGQDKIACHLPLILGPWDAVIPVTVCFPLGGAVRLENKKEKYGTFATTHFCV